jgi:hypothetical protein
MSGVVTDETGLHAEGCECPRCEAGYRPTALERAAARRALQLRLARLADEERRRKAAEPLKVRPRLVPPVRPVPTEPWPAKETIREQLKGLKR